jgi:hypothetical protein
MDRVVTLLQAQVAKGAVAESLQTEINSVREALRGQSLVHEMVDLNTSRYVDVAVADATREILSSGGELTTIGEVMGRSFSIGLANGIAIGIRAALYGHER